MPVVNETDRLKAEEVAKIQRKIALFKVAIQSALELGVMVSATKLWGKWGFLLSFFALFRMNIFGMNMVNFIKQNNPLSGIDEVMKWIVNGTEPETPETH